GVRRFFRNGPSVESLDCRTPISARRNARERASMFRAAVRNQSCGRFALRNSERAGAALMRITIVLGAFFPVPPTMGGGVEKVWFTLAPEFVKRGHEVVIVSRKTPERLREETIEGVKHLRVDGFDTPRSLLWLKFLDLIYSLRTKSILPEADIIVTNTFWLPILLRDSKRGKIYVHVGRYPKGQMRFYGKAARLQAPSRSIARAIASEAPRLEHKVRAIPYPVTRSIRQRTDSPERTITASPAAIGDREKIMLFVGRVHPEK